MNEFEVDGQEEDKLMPLNESLLFLSQGIFQ
jgi:hypothetical protein